MFEVHSILGDIVGLLQSADISSILPQVGVGGEIEAKQSVDIEPLLEWSLIFLTGMATIFGFILAFAAKKFAVKIDPRVEQVNDLLAHAHCGACGFAGCEQYAEAVINDPDMSPSLCIPAGERTALMIAELTGKKAEVKERQFARIICGGGASKSAIRYKYEGIHDCRAAMLSGGGDKSCVYGCLGYGTCESVCPFDAIRMNRDNLPIIDIRKCTACGKCVTACPKMVIELLPEDKAVFVACRSHEKAPETRKQCSAGCIACGMCVKVCPFDAPKVEKNLAVIDQVKCKVCGLCVPKCPTGAIADLVRRASAFITDVCIGCGLCVKACPVDAISGEPKTMHVVNGEKCIGCGLCAPKCPVQAVTGTFNARQIKTDKKKLRKAS
jgi:Na+-translocating ferredoxin:NAD+ oxidoreductase subunit B